VIDFEPTVPKLMEEPLTVPLRLVATFPNPEILIVPFKVFPVSCQLSVKVPLKVPP